MDKFKSCPSCNEQLDQCLSCASYVVDGERIYYEKLKDFGATQDHELRFINRIQKHRTTAFFHNGKLYIPSRQGRSVPLAIGLQWEAWQARQAEIDEKDKRIEEALVELESLHDKKWAEWKEQADMHSQGEANAYEHAMRILEKALRGDNA